MAFALPKLPWSPASLAPYISAETIQYHYGKHHQAYVTKLNELVKGNDFEKKSLIEIIKTADGPMFNQAAQIWNHTFYWHSLSPEGGGEPGGPLKDRIVKDFGSFDSFRKQFSSVAVGHFGSGWAWLLYDPKSDALKIHQTHDAGNPIRDGAGIPLLTCDVWEHAYYIDYRNARAEYVENFWSLANWKFANDNLANAKEGKHADM